MRTTSSESGLSLVLVALMKGIVHREADAGLWQALVQLQSHVRDYVQVLGLDLDLDEAEGYAYLRQRPAADGEPELPRLVARRPLGYQLSLVLVVLRKKLAEFDAKSGDTRLVLTGEEIADLVRVLLPDSANQARVLDRLESHIKKAIELGFLRPMRGAREQFEVQRILKAFVDAQWLGDFEMRLAAYRAHIESIQGRIGDEAS